MISTIASISPFVVASSSDLRPSKAYRVPALHVFPEALAVLILSFLKAREICLAITLVDMSWWRLAHSPGLWKQLCVNAGKGGIASTTTLTQQNMTWEDLYKKNPHVPLDFPSIEEAVQAAGSGSCVLIADGEYKEHLRLKKDITLMAVPSEKDKVVIKFETRSENVPCMFIQTREVTLRGLTLVHTCRGTNIWDGNSCILAQHMTCLRIDNCEITSTSGRGLVAVRGSRVIVDSSRITRCAATGFYLGVIGRGGREV